MSPSPDPLAPAAAVFEGVGVALLTLFTDDGELDVAATAEHAARLVDLGVRAVVVAGTSGEAPALSADERVALLEGVRAVVPPSAAVVIAGTGGPSARQAVAYTRDAVAAGADAVAALSPPGAPDPRPYYERVAEAAGTTPVLAYHFPAVSPPGIPLPMLAELPVSGCKDSSGDPDRLLETLSTWPRPLYVGTSALLALAGPLGCAGAILALANAEPERCAAAFAGDAKAQLALAEAHRESLVPFPAGIKRLTARRFNTSTVTRMG
ncbi:MAG TPA: dihydrodipicolinate synthase family protein [Acidimicrobiales bacterium]|nr:dihydrodipicolinate synthase family protein [Acidimicrobiales bacterium]